MKILLISNEIRHELGCAASLQMLRYDVTYMHIGGKYEPLHKKVVYTDQESVKVNFLQINSPILLHSIIHPHNFIPKEVIKETFDIIIATPSTPFYIAHYIARIQDTPIVLRIWGIRANKLFDHIIYGKNYLEVFNFCPSILHNLMQIWNSQAIVVMDDSTKSFLKKVPLFKKLNVIYPTYASLYEENSHDLLEVKELIKEQNYIFSFVTMRKTGSVFRLEQRLLFKVLYYVSMKCPEVDVIIAGGTLEEAKKKFGLSYVPKNLKFAGSSLSDNALKILYERASLVVIPIFFRSLSNRLLEALYYGRPILTNSIAKLLHNKLEHSHHVFVSDNYSKYPSIIIKLLKNETLLEELALGAKEAYSSFFSARKCGFAMKRVIERIVSNKS
jgi:glycosyltransferase involved in cell wall biosynthesis